MIEDFVDRPAIWKEVLLVFSAFFLPGMVFGGSALDPRAFEQLEHHVMVVIVALPQIGLIVHLLNVQPQLRLDHYGITPIRTRDPLLALALALLLLTLMAALALLLTLLPDSRTVLDDGLRWQFRRWEYLPLVVLTSIAVGYREELFFRGYLIGRMADAGVAPSLAVVASSVLFGLGHIYQGADAVLVTTVIGAVLALVFVRRRNLHVIALAHALYNSVILSLGALVGGVPY